MNKNYEQLIRKVKNRTNPDDISESVLLSKTFSSELREIGNKKALEYVRRIMHGVEPNYTQKTVEAGKRVMGHLKDVDSSLDYKFQGSVMTNTHIKGYSDIDLVQITNRFFRHDSKDLYMKEYENPYRSTLIKTQLSQIINSVYFSGDANVVLKDIREKAEEKLLAVYKNVNIGKPKSIEVRPTSPVRMIDVVTASWFKSLDSILVDDEDYRGIEIYDKEKNLRLSVDYPFIKIKFLNKRDNEVNGRLKKMIRFLKSIKADSDNSDQISLSSFDIASICYNIEVFNYDSKPYFELVEVLLNEFKKIIDNQFYRDGIRSIDNTESIFKDKPKKIKGAILLYREIKSVHDDLTQNLIEKRFVL